MMAMTEEFISHLFLTVRHLSVQRRKSYREPFDSLGMSLHDIRIRLQIIDRCGSTQNGVSLVDRSIDFPSILSHGLCDAAPLRLLGRSDAEIVVQMLYVVIDLSLLRCLLARFTGIWRLGTSRCVRRSAYRLCRGGANKNERSDHCD